MTDFKIKGKCFGCRKIKWFISKRKLATPVGEVTSRERFCPSCYKELTNKVCQKN